MLKPDKEILQEGDRMTVKTLSSIYNHELNFEMGVEFEEGLRFIDGRMC